MKPEISAGLKAHFCKAAGKINILQNIEILKPEIIANLKTHSKNLEITEEVACSPGVSSNTSSDTNNQKSKWTFKYQRSERSQRTQEKNNENQSLITNYFSLVEKISEIIINSPNDNALFLSEITIPEENQSLLRENKINLSNFLQNLLSTTLQNTQTHSNKNIYDIFPPFYHLDICKTREVSEEGNIDFTGLLQFLDERQLPKIVWISEDATRITTVPS